MMKALLLYDRQSVDYQGQNLSVRAAAAARAVGCELTTQMLDGDRMRPCRGCFQCWVKTPGLCVFTDDNANTISRQVMQSDALILLTEICYGGLSYDIKAFLDRFIPNILPFFRLIDGEMHHQARYQRIPAMITVGYGPYTPAEGQTFRELAERNAINLQPPAHSVFCIDSFDDVDKTMQSLSAALAGEGR